MTEQRLIDANKLLEDMNNYNVDIEVNGLDSDEEKIRKACQAVHDHAIKCINRQPVVPHFTEQRTQPTEVREVVHARWVKLNSTQEHFCDNCGVSFNLYAYCKADYNYCPYCGAQMDRSEDDG